MHDPTSQDRAVDAAVLNLSIATCAREAVALAENGQNAEADVMRHAVALLYERSLVSA